MAFTLCLNTSTIKPQPILEKIRLAAEAGFAGIELWINDVYEYVGQGGEVRDIEKALSDHGLIVPCAIAVRGWGEAKGPEYPIMLDEVKRRMEMAARLGSPYLVATPPRDECPDCQLAERYRDDDQAYLDSLKQENLDAYAQAKYLSHYSTYTLYQNTITEYYRQVK